MAVSDELLKQHADMQVARAPVFTEYAAVDYSTKPPSGAADMTSLATPAAGGTAIKCPVEMMLRENPSHRSARVTIELFDATTYYSALIDGNPHTELGTTDIETTIDALVVNVNAGRAGSGEETEFGRSVVTVDTYDVTTSYTITLDGVAHTVVGESDSGDTATALAAAIANGSVAWKFTANASGDDVTINNNTADTYTIEVSVVTGSGVMTFVLLPAVASREGSGAASVLLVEGTSPADYTFDSMESGGSGWRSHAVDATEVTFVIWGLHVGRTYPVELSGERLTITKNWTERLDVAGLTHLVPGIKATDGLVRWAIGPADLE